MQELSTLATSSATMSSLEIAELTGKEHYNVLRDIREMLDELILHALKTEGMQNGPDLHALKAERMQKIPTNNGGFREVPVIDLPAEEVMILITGYSVPLRAKVVRRVRELEQIMSARQPLIWLSEDEVHQLVNPGKKPSAAVSSALARVSVGFRASGLGHHIGTDRYSLEASVAALYNMSKNAPLIDVYRERVERLSAGLTLEAPTYHKLSHLN